MRQFFTIFSILVMSAWGFSQMGGGQGRGGHGMNGSGSGDIGTGEQGGGMGSHGGGMQDGDFGQHGMIFFGQMPGYDLNTVTTITGEVVESDFGMDEESGFGPGEMMNGASRRGMALELLTDQGESIFVMTAPYWYLDEQGIEFQVGDILTITGSVVDWEEDSYLLAATIVKDDVALVLRDELGNPLWISQRGYGNGNGMHSAFPIMDYDVEQEVTIQGQISELSIGTMMPDTHPAYQLSIVDENGQTNQVMVAPYWYLYNQGIEFNVGDQVTLTGVFYQWNDETEIFLVRVLDWNDIEIELRDQDGYPLWSAFHHRN